MRKVPPHRERPGRPGRVSADTTRAGESTTVRPVGQRAREGAAVRRAATRQGQSTLVAGIEAARGPAVQQLSSPIEALIERIESRLKPAPYRATVRLRLHGQAKHLEWDFTRAPFQTLEILQITDMQWGHIACQRDRVREYRDWILSAANKFMLWTGDNVDSAHMQSKGTTYDNTGNPQQQCYEFCEEWAPAAHRILGYVGGNHERRTLTQFGDLGISIAAQLKVPYSNGKQYIDIRFGAHRPFQITQWHGMGGARTKGTVAQHLSRFAGEGDSQLYLMGHHHQAMLIPLFKERRIGREIGHVKTIAACGSSFLNTWGSYAEVAGYAPNDVLMPRVILERSGKWEVTIR